jgi:hypothetical protein
MSTLYLVVRRTWHSPHRGYDLHWMDGGGVVLAAFPHVEDAEAHARELEAAVRRDDLSPFAFQETLGQGGGFREGIGTTDEQACRTVRELGLEPPEMRSGTYPWRPWLTWYESIADTLNPEQRDALWCLFGYIRVYEVIEIPLED